jgi:hypothetical protein
MSPSGNWTFFVSSFVLAFHAPFRVIKQGEKRREVVPAVVWTTRKIVCRFFSVEITFDLFDHSILVGRGIFKRRNNKTSCCG